MKRAFKHLAGLSLAALTAVAHADNVISGAGGITCARFIQAIDANDPHRQEVIQWIQGFLGAVNVLRNEAKQSMIDLPSSEELGEHTEQFCRQHRDSRILSAAMLIRSELIPPGSSGKAAKH